ncbi:transposase [Candidatus Peregrinibacteria bacterium]|nr:transposase [Candidatus Peregrinibacteria bacterium]
MIIGEIGDISRFKSPAALAKYAGCAPREHSSLEKPVVIEKQGAKIDG